MVRTPQSRQEPVDVVGGSTFGVYPKISVAKTYNMYASDNFLIPFAGYRRIYDFFPSGEGRGLYVSARGRFMIAVINQVVWRIDNKPGFDTVTAYQIGNLTTQTGEVFIDENLNSQICIVDGTNAYIYNYSLPAPNLTQQTNGALGTGALVPSYVEYHNTYFLFGNANVSGTDSRWYAYEFATTTTIDELANTTNFGLQTKPDNPIAVKRIPNQSANVLVFGRTVTEIHQNTGGDDVYQRNNYVGLDYGLAAIDTLASNDEHVTFLGRNEKNDPVLIDFSGQQGKRISTDGIDHQLKSLKNPEKSTADFYRQDGHLFYIITFYDPRDNLTLAYDFNTEMFFHLSDHKLNYYPPRKIVNFNQKDYFVSLNNASLYQLSTDFTTNNENTLGVDPVEDPDCIHEIQRIRVCSPIRSQRTTKFIANYLNIMIEQGNEDFNEANQCIEYIITEDGVMVITEDGAIVIPEDAEQDGCTVGMYQPRVDLAISIDGGVTFSNYVSKHLNLMGYRQNMLSWNRLGACNEFIAKFRFWNAGRVCVSGGVLDVRT